MKSAFVVQKVLLYMNLQGVSIYWTGLLDWNTGLDYWTELFYFFGQVCVYLVLT